MSARSRAEPLKVTGVRTFIVDAHRTGRMIVRVETDAGMHGTGEAMVERRELAVAETVGAIARYFDACHVGGLAEMNAIAPLAETRFLPVAPHNPMGPVGNAMTQQLAVVPNFAWLETMMIDVPWRGEVVRETCAMENGHMLIPDALGLGIEFDEEAAARHEYKFRPPGHFRKRELWPEASVPWYEAR